MDIAALIEILEVMLDAVDYDDDYECGWGDALEEVIEVLNKAQDPTVEQEHGPR